MILKLMRKKKTKQKINKSMEKFEYDSDNENSEIDYINLNCRFLDFL